MKQKKLSIYTFIGARKQGFILSVILSLLGVAAEMVPYFVGVRVICMMYEGQSELHAYVLPLGIAVAAYIARALLTTLSTWASHKATFDVLYEIRCALIEKMKRVPLGYIQETPTGTLKNTIVDNVDGLEQYLAHYIPELTANLLVPLVLLVYLFIVSWQMTLIMFLTLPAVVLCCVGMMRGFDEKCRKFYAAKDAVNDAVIEYVNGIEVIKAFNRSADSYAKYSNAVYNNAKFGYEWQKGAQGFLSGAICILHSTMLTILPIGYYFWHKDSISVEVLLTFIILAIGLMTPMIKAMFMFETTTKMEAEFDKIAAVLEAPELVRPETSAPLTNHEVVLKNVSFRYQNAEDSAMILKDINLTMKPNKVTALVGPSGSGKSTIAKLIAGFWDVNAGEISIGGVPLRQLSQENLNQSIAYVSQDSFLFNDTVMENIRIGRKGATDEDVKNAAKACGCHAFIEQLEHGYQTMVGDKGGHLSGGERQRITIVRAMLKNAPIVILDEATSFTDPENEAVLQRSISRLVAGKTLIIIAHRLSTIADADQIALIHDGQVEACGTHDQLYQESALYRHMWDSHVGVRSEEMEE